MDRCEEVGRELVVAGGNAAEVFQPAEHALDGIAPAVEHTAERWLEAAIGLGWNVRRGTPLIDRLAHRVGIVTTVCDQQRVRWEQRQQGEGGAAIGGLAAAESEGARTPVFVGQRVELGGASAPADADRLRPLPPFPPAAQR
jgi:hypothetical protein